MLTLVLLLPRFWGSQQQKNYNYSFRVSGDTELVHAVLVRDVDSNNVSDYFRKRLSTEAYHDRKINSSITLDDLKVFSTYQITLNFATPKNYARQIYVKNNTTFWDYLSWNLMENDDEIEANATSYTTTIISKTLASSLSFYLYHSDENMESHFWGLLDTNKGALSNVYGKTVSSLIDGQTLTSVSQNSVTVLQARTSVITVL